MELFDDLFAETYRSDSAKKKYDGNSLRSSPDNYI